MFAVSSVPLVTHVKAVDASALVERFVRRITQSGCGRMNRPRDLTWEALLEVCGAGPGMTKSERGRYNKAVKELKEVGATPDQIRQRAQRYRNKWPNLTVTPTALTAHWSSLSPPKRVAAPIVAADPERLAVFDPEDAQMTEAEKAEGRRRLNEMIDKTFGG